MSRRRHTKRLMYDGFKTKGRRSRGRRGDIGQDWESELKTNPKGRNTPRELAKVQQIEHMGRKSNYMILARTELAETNKSQECYTNPS